MALVHGYTSSEDEHDPNLETAVTNTRAVNLSDRPQSSNVVNAALASLPKPGKARKRRILPLLLENENEDAASVSSSDWSNSDKAVQPDPLERHDSQPLDTLVTPRYEENKGAKRTHLIDDDQERYMPDEAIRAGALSPDISSELSSRMIQSGNSDRDQEKFIPPSTETLGLDLHEDSRAAARASASFVTLNAADIRADALRYQSGNGGLVANLQKSRGISGRQNQITNLARAAAKQRESKSEE